MANLLTIEAKRGLVRERRARQWLVVLALIGLLFLVATIFNLTIWLSFRIQKEALPTQLSGSETTSLNLEQENREAKDKLTRLSKWWFKNNWSLVMAKIKEVQPQTIKITQLAGLSSDKTNALSVVISGQASRREDLVKFVEALKQEKFFSEVDLPIDSLLSTNKGQFTLDLEIKNND